MILNTSIWQETIAAAKSAASASPAWLRAIDRAVIEIERSIYWSYVGGVLTLRSTTSGSHYTVDDNHECPAKGGICKHRAARRLMSRYTERLAAEKSARENAILIKRQGKEVRVNGWAV